MDALYDADFLLWSERQATLLRRLAQGERVNDAVDWDNLIEEVGDLGRSQLNAVQGLLTVCLEHLMLVHDSPGPELASHWKVEAATALDDAALRYAPSMGQRIDLGALWQRARRRAILHREAEPHFARRIPATCPFTLEDLLRPEPDLDALLARLVSAGEVPR